MNRSLYLYFLITIFVLAVVNSLSAQSQLVEKGDRLYNNNEFALAIDYYEKHLKNSDDFSSKKKLAFCYMQTNKDTKALELMEDIVEHPLAKPDDYLLYAQLLKRFRKYDKAKSWFQNYAKHHPEDKSIAQLILSCNLIDEIKDSELYIVNPISINTPQADFTSAFYKNGLVFVSGRPNQTSKKIDGRTSEHYLDLYFSEKKGKLFSTPVPFSEELNTKYHEGPACFSSNERFIYFTRNKGNLNLEGKSELTIYSARSNGSSWDKPELFEFSGQNFSMGHPSISSDGRYFFFISNMEGGYGGTDIYVCRKQGFSWSFPINLGASVNTSGNEMFPFIADDGYLYFSSDGHIGFGGLDIFKTIFEQNKWTYPVNLGPPFNSSKDDFGLLIQKNKELGYFSSNRNSNDDIFEFQPNPEKIQKLKGQIVANKNKQQLEGVEVLLMDQLSKEKITHTDNNGSFSFDIFKEKNYSLLVTKPGYKTKRILYFPAELQNVKQIDIVMEEVPWVSLKGNIIDPFSAEGVKAATVQVINQIYNNNRYCQTDQYGDFEMDIDPSTSYNIIIYKEGYFTKVINNYRYQSDKYEQIELQKFNRNQMIELYGVEFAPGSVELSETSITELENLTGLLLVNPHIAIEIAGYTNTDKGKKENRTLSNERAKKASEYIISKGITPNRVQFKAGGYDPEKSALVVRLIDAL